MIGAAGLADVGPPPLLSLERVEGESGFASVMTGRWAGERPMLP